VREYEGFVASLYAGAKKELNVNTVRIA
jgi:hypothetical protein